MRRLHCAILVCLMLIFTSVTAQARDWWEEAGSDDPLDQKTVVQSGTLGALDTAVRVNWVDEYIEVMAGGTADPRETINMAHAVSVSRKTARHLAYEKLAETIRGINITSDAVYDRELMTDSNLRTGVNALVSGAKVVGERDIQLADGSVWAEVRIGIHITGPNSLMQKTAPWLAKYETPSSSHTPPSGSASASQVGRATGLVVDAGGLGVRPAMVAKIYSADGSIVYGPQNLTQEYLARFGQVGYSRSVSEARSLKRVGGRPLVVKALEAKGDYKSDVVVSVEDAARIRRELAEKQALSECRVVFAVN
jgi:hypothetical protein